MKLKDLQRLIKLKQLIKDNDNGIVRVKNSITGEYFMVDDIEIDVHGDLLIKIV